MTEFAHMFTSPYQFPPIELTLIFGPYEWDELLKNLRLAEAASGKNKHDCVTALIAVCIDNQIDTMGLILDVLGPFGYDRRHVAIHIKLWTGNTPGQALWNVGTNGKYYLIVPAA